MQKIFFQYHFQIYFQVYRQGNPKSFFSKEELSLIIKEKLKKIKKFKFFIFILKYKHTKHISYYNKQDINILYIKILDIKGI